MLQVLLALTAVILTTTPALAQHGVSGYYNRQAIREMGIGSSSSLP